jgi:TolA-binding protein
MSAKIKGLLQKINFIETDMELHKQILASIPSDDKKQITTTITKIADLKQQINELRQQIKQIDEDEYNKIIIIEKAAQTFRKIAKDKKFVQVNTLNESGVCFITFNDGTRLECLVTAKEENGNWTVLTLEGETKEYPVGLIQ